MKKFDYYKLLKFNFNLDEKIFYSFKKDFEKQSNNLSLETNSNKKMIFIIGMPRSGTSLIEQIISIPSRNLLHQPVILILLNYSSSPKFNINTLTLDREKNLQL